MSTGGHLLRARSALGWALVTILLTATAASAQRVVIELKKDPQGKLRAQLEEALRNSGPMEIVSPANAAGVGAFLVGSATEPIRFRILDESRRELWRKTLPLTKGRLSPVHASKLARALLAAAGVETQRAMDAGVATPTVVSKAAVESPGDAGTSSSSDEWDDEEIEAAQNSPALPEASKRSSPAPSPVTRAADDSPENSIELSWVSYGEVSVASLGFAIQVSERWSVVGGADLISELAGHEMHRPYAQLGGVWDMTDAWALELLGEYGPQVTNIGRGGGSGSLSYTFNNHDEDSDSTEDDDDIVKIEFSIIHYAWADAQGPGGPDLLQTSAELSGNFTFGPLSLTPIVTVFAYDRGLYVGRETWFPALSDLAGVGWYAPRARFSVEGELQVGAHFSFSLKAEEIVYAAEAGTGRLAVAGLEWSPASWVKLRGGAGVLWNDLDPTLRNFDPGGLLPIFEGGISFNF